MPAVMDIAGVIWLSVASAAISYTVADALIFKPLRELVASKSTFFRTSLVLRVLHGLLGLLSIGNNLPAELIQRAIHRAYPHLVHHGLALRVPMGADVHPCR